MDLSAQCLYPTLGPLVPPMPLPDSSNPLPHLYPTLAPRATPTDSLSAGATGTTMAPSLPILPSLPLGLPGEQPPAYTPQPTDGHHSLAYSPAGGVGLGLGGQRVGGPPQPDGGVGGDGEELLFLPRGVQMFFVSSDGQVSAPSYPGYLRVIRFSSHLKDMANGGASAFLHVRKQLGGCIRERGEGWCWRVCVFKIPIENSILSPTHLSYYQVHGE